MPSKSLTIHSNCSGSSTWSTETNMILHMFAEFLMLEKVRSTTDTDFCSFFLSVFRLSQKCVFDDDYLDFCSPHLSGSRSLPEPCDGDFRSVQPHLLLYTVCRSFFKSGLSHLPLPLHLPVEVHPLSLLRLLLEALPSGHESLAFAPHSLCSAETYGLDCTIVSMSFSSPSATWMTSSISPAPILFSSSSTL